MPPQKTQISCPRCRKPVVAQIEQLFDVTSDPGAKQRLLGSVSNFAVCQSCGYNGPLATPIVYHDADKELLLTYFPGELGCPSTSRKNSSVRSSPRSPIVYHPKNGKPTSCDRKVS